MEACQPPDNNLTVMNIIMGCQNPFLRGMKKSEHPAWPLKVKDKICRVYVERMLKSIFYSPVDVLKDEEDDLLSNRPITG